MRGDDIQIRHDVEAELDWDSPFDSRNIGVTVNNRIVTLTGHVGSYAECRAALEAAQSVTGVSAVANELCVQLPIHSALSDTDIAKSAVRALKSHAAIPTSGIKLAVQNGWVSLEGEVDYRTQKQAAENAVSTVRGVAGVVNAIALRVQASSSVNVKGQILHAFRRVAGLECERIHVSTLDGVVTLEGEVGSLLEREQAECAAWQAPGVSQVIDNLTVNAGL